ncbi:AI-2E family transporter [Bradyrhizobium huanghuaihaiense]|uniref:AI-2E family transporter n=1 Tax=Bradyrhizobium huanghuaihaiense TaxID=990078 RepID=UPI0021AA11DC|nr:AI-2E family transporter [Bradyrhizobium sp. CB3035]UWU75476.1 AI-2E family transporter [Bradyrhizobium sp. CB3035]
MPGPSRLWTSPGSIASSLFPAVVASNLFIGLALVALLYFGRELFVPVVVALLLSFVLAPVVRFFHRLYAGRVGSVLAAVTLAFLLIFGLSAIMTQQVAQLAENLPRYQLTISDKIHSVQDVALSPGIFNRLKDMLGDLRQEMSKPQEQGRTNSSPDQPAQTAAGEPQVKPLPVEIQQPPPRPFDVVQTIVGPLLAPLATTGIVIVLVIFMLLFREDLRGRFVRIAGAEDLGRTSEAIDDAGRRLSRYFLTQTCINATFGIVIGISLAVIGIPNPVLWGIFAALMRFVPYIGAFIAAAVPAALAIAVDPGWSMLFWTVALFVIVEPILSQIVEPMLYGHNTGLSPVAVVVAAAFWTWLWGPIGLLLSTPLTVCLVVLGRHVERLEFLDVILGDQPALTPEQNFFQRMLAGDPDEAADQAERFMKEKSLCAYYDEIAIPGLLLARADARRGALDLDRLRRIKETVEGVIDDLSDRDDCAPSVKSNEDLHDSSTLEIEVVDTPDLSPPVVPTGTVRSDWRDGKPVLCIGARDPLDEATANMIAQLLEKHGIGVRIEPSTAASSSNIFGLDTANIRIVCVSCLGSGSPAHLRFLLRRLRRKMPHASLLVGLWGSTKDSEDEESLDDETIGADFYAKSLRKAVELCIEEAHRSTAAPEGETKRTEAHRSRAPRSAGRRRDRN